MTSIPLRRSHPLVFVVAGGLVAGTLDIAYACVFWAIKRDVPVQRILQSVAAGLLGEASFEGGGATAAALGGRTRVQRSAVDHAQRGGARPPDRRSHRALRSTRAAGVGQPNAYTFASQGNNGSLPTRPGGGARGT
jgi:hypothetical protein